MNTLSEQEIPIVYRMTVDGKEVEVKRTFASTEISLLQCLIRYLQNQEMKERDK